MLSFILGTMFGFVVTCIWFATRTVGKLRVDHSNPEKDLYRFEIDDLDKLSKRKMVILKIDHRADLSHD